MYFKEEVIALEAKYVNGIGNMTFVHKLDGSLIKDKRKISTIFKQMAKYDLIDMKQVRKMIKIYLNINKDIPYVFNKDNIYIPVKTRKPICKNDGASSFIKISCIDSYIGKEIYLSNGDCIKTTEKKEIVEKRIKSGILSGLVIKEKNYILNNFLEQ